MLLLTPGTLQLSPSCATHDPSLGTGLPGLTSHLPQCHGLSKALGQPMTLCLGSMGCCSGWCPCPTVLHWTALPLLLPGRSSLLPPSSLPPVLEKHLSGSSSISRSADKGSHTNAHWGHISENTVVLVCPQSSSPWVFCHNRHMTASSLIHGIPGTISPSHAIFPLHSWSPSVFFSPCF